MAMVGAAADGRHHTEVRGSVLGIGGAYAARGVSLPVDSRVTPGSAARKVA
jgi:hypothetical protein